MLLPVSNAQQGMKTAQLERSHFRAPLVNLLLILQRCVTTSWKRAGIPTGICISADRTWTEVLSLLRLQMGVPLTLTVVRITADTSILFPEQTACVLGNLD